MRTQPNLSVGILHSNRVRFTLNGEYKLVEKDNQIVTDGKIYSGAHEISLTSEGKLLFEGESMEELKLAPVAEPGSQEATFWLRDVVIGVNFHWERKEDQKFGGILKFIVEEGAVCAINILGVEDYLTSVISSEMSASASEQLLKAHAVISRSWLMAQIEKPQTEKVPSTIVTHNTGHDCEELVKWYDRDDHKNFDVCADDHCQRYQGLTRASTETVRRAIDQTWGEILYHDGKICDARFYKCCGGMLEEFESAWEDRHYDYLVAVRDNEDGKDAVKLDLTDELNAEAWILSSPDAFCNTQDARILSQVLNNYDQETVNFYRWTVELSQEEIANLIRTKSGEDFGEIIDLVPVKRGTSGRLIKLKIVGSKKTKIVGKELEIRRILSPSHLYSSAFVVRRYDARGEQLPVNRSAEDGKTSAPAAGERVTPPAKFKLIGAGWGHGVGLCQIGAAVMGEKGYAYDAILSHYYPNSELIKKY